MCGIAGIFGSDTSGIEAMVATLGHRGPDGRGRARTWDWPATVRALSLQVSGAKYGPVNDGCVPHQSPDGFWFRLA